MLWDKMVILCVLFAPDDDIGGANATPIIQAGRIDKHDDQTSRICHSCRNNNRQPKIITIEELAGRGAEKLTT